MLAVERGERGRQPRRVHRRRRDPHAAARRARVALEDRPRPRLLGEHRLGARQQRLARGRQLGAARRAPQQLDAQLGLQPPHLLGERGLREPAAPPRRG